MATVTNGKHLKLDNFETIVDMMMSIVYREKGAEFFDAYEKEVRAREGAGIRWELERMFKTLGADAVDGGAAATAGASTCSLSSVAPVATVTPLAPKKRRINVTAKTGPSPAKRTLFAAKAPPKAIKTGRVAKKSPRTTIAKTSVRKLTAATVTPSTSGTATISRRTSRVLRESVTDRHMLRHLNWSRWQEAFRDSPPPKRGSHATWKARASHQEGYRACDAFTDTNKPAMYELSVQTTDSSSKVPVWCGFTTGFSGKSWDTHFLRSTVIQQNIDNILQRGGKLHVRRATDVTGTLSTATGAVCSSMAELKKLVRDTYDYAWSGKSTSRQLFLRRSRRSAVLARRGQPY